MPNIILNEKAQAEIQELLNELPISALPKVQKLVSIFNANTDPTPIGGGGGGGAPKPKKDA